MKAVRPWHSVVGRVVGVMLISGAVASAGLSVLEWRRSRAVLRMDLRQHTTITVRNLQNVMQGLRPGAGASATAAVLGAFVTEDDQIRAARLTEPGHEPVSVGDWSAADSKPAAWALSEVGTSQGGELALDRLTFVHAPFRRHGRATELELLVDGPAAVAAMRQQLYTGLGTMWLLLALVLLLSLLMLRRWFIGPLGELIDLVSVDAGPAPFARLAERQPGEFRQLSRAIAQMLERLAQAKQRLAERERAFANLYDHAPTAMLSLDGEGRVTEANRRAAELFEAPTTASLAGRRASDLIASADRPLLQQTIERLTYHDAAACELRVAVGERLLDCNLEAVADRDEDGALRTYRLSLTDVSRSRRLRRELENRTRLLNLVLDHMSDAIVLVDSDGRVAAHNQQLATLLQLRPEQLIGRRFDHADFWDALGVVNREQFIGRMRQIDGEHERPAQERFETRAGVFLFQGIPVRDVADGAVGRLWVLQETTPQEHSQRLISQQNKQLQLLKDTGAQLCDVVRVQPLLQRAAEHVFEGIGVDAVGIAIRTAERGKRCLQIVHRGSAAYLLQTNRRLVESVERDLMPRVLGSRDVALWTDLRVKTPWAEAARNAGLTSVAAVPLRGSSDAQGIIWIARRAGERLERQHIMLIETIAPLLAARLQIAQLSENMQRSDLTDRVTGLPSREQLDHLLSQQARRPNQPCAVLVVHFDRFAQVNEMLDHDGADAVLKRLADRVLGTCRRNTFVCRETGPAFGIVLPGAGAEGATKLAQRIIEVIGHEPIESPDGRRFEATASIGVGVCPADGRNPFDAWDAALVRVELAKQQGRGRVVAEGPALPDRAAG